MTSPKVLQTLELKNSPQRMNVKSNESRRCPSGQMCPGLNWMLWLGLRQRQWVWWGEYPFKRNNLNCQTCCYRELTQRAVIRRFRRWLILGWWIAQLNQLHAMVRTNLKGQLVRWTDAQKSRNAWQQKSQHYQQWHCRFGQFVYAALSHPLILHN